MAVLYIVATPIGNLEDITLRALRVFKEADLVVCEDARVTRKLLSRYDISTPVESFYKFQKKKGSIKPEIRKKYIISELGLDKNIALITDAGTPGISDPGNQIVKDAVENKITVIPIPGVSALIALVSVCGIDMSRFLFLGFPPRKKGRETFFRNLAQSEYPVVYFESPHRVIKNLELLQKLQENKKVILGRELTKMFEEIIRGTAEEVLQYFREHPDKVRGEFVIIVY